MCIRDSINAEYMGFNERNQNQPQKPNIQEQYKQDVQIQEGYKDKLQKQDNQIENANHLVLGVKGIAQEMNKELVEQDVVINDLTENVDVANAELAKTNRKLTFLVKKSSNCCLGIIIFLEIAALVCILAVSYTHLRAHETGRNLVCRLLLEKKKI
eukprot:TRINITY_DN11346_c0_g1_i1.p2 TRINITY_DN11346_c0_g1~~TRINITY_DN11346_c0_g1_i1.p2  ORF type:complete len:156 (+),score=41.61 TRINITY_DN11346_c0_g1_i1:135-602(+)